MLIPPNWASGAPETTPAKRGRPPSKKRPRPEVAEGFETTGVLSPQAVGYLKALKHEVDPLTGELYSQRDAAARCNVDQTTVGYHWSMAMDVGETGVSETPRKEDRRAEFAAERAQLVAALMTERRCTAREICLALLSEHGVC